MRQKRLKDRARVVTYLPEEVVQNLDRLAIKYEASRSEIVARLVLRAFEPQASPSPPSPQQASRPSKPSPPSEPSSATEAPPEPPRFQSDLMRRMREQG
jgi:hypothetical protein